MNRAMFSLVAALSLAICADSFAQGYPGRSRGGGMGGTSGDSARRDRDSQQQRASSPIQADPFSSLERELPSLNVDLMLTATQVEAWRLFERDVRDVAEMERMQRRHMMAREATDGQRTAPALIGTLAEDQRMKADATMDLKSHLDALYAKLTDPQKQMLDRRLVQSQSDPLGK